MKKHQKDNWVPLKLPVDVITEKEAQVVSKMVSDTQNKERFFTSQRVAFIGTVNTPKIFPRFYKKEIDTVE